MTPIIAIVLAVLVGISCGRVARPSGRREASQGSGAGTTGAANTASTNQTPETYRETVGPSGEGESFRKGCREKLHGYGMRVAQSPQDERLIAFVTEYAKANSIDLPKNNSFVVWKRNGAEFSVTAADLDDFCAGRKSRSQTFRIVEHAERFEVLYLEANI